MDFIAAQMVVPRKRDVSDRERLASAALAKKRAKHKGRCHWRNWERRQMALAKKKADEAVNAKRSVVIGRYLDEARAYWRGDRTDLPRKPA